MEDFTEEEKARLTDLAQDLNAAGRVGRKIRATLIWIAGGVTAWWVVWENILKHVWKG